MRVLVTVTPRMYRQAIALTIRRQRPGCEVRIAAPEDAEGELATFRPHLLVHNDDDELGPEAVAGIRWRVEVQYSDGMDAEIRLDGEVSNARDMSTEDLIRIVDLATAMVDR
jgi:hypothetical protein